MKLSGRLVKRKEFVAPSNKKNHTIILTYRENKTACLCPIVKETCEFIQKKTRYILSIDESNDIFSLFLGKKTNLRFPGFRLCDYYSIAHSVLLSIRQKACCSLHIEYH